MICKNCGAKLRNFLGLRKILEQLQKECFGACLVDGLIE
jgi:hypothetical protein